MLGLGRALCRRRSALFRYPSSAPNVRFSFRRVVRVDTIPQQLRLDLGAIDDFCKEAGGEDTTSSRPYYTGPLTLGRYGQSLH